jgi:hypothetical protein
MHDPLRVAFEIKRPWPNPRRANGSRYWPALVTVWHREPGGHDSGEVCKEYRRVQNANGEWRYRFLNGWRFHVHHWRLQVSPLQDLRRWALTRCAWCGGRHSKMDAVNISHQWDGPAGRWWQGAPGRYHHDCSAVARAHSSCICVEPQCRDSSAEHGPYGTCARCGNGRAFGDRPGARERQRLLATVPAGKRDPDIYRRVCDMAKADKKVAA